MSHCWSRLQLPGDFNAPLLLFKYMVSTSGYDIFLTDLTSVWSESLDREQVIHRAIEDNNSLDPDDEITLFEILLSKIREALSGGDNCSILLTAKPGSDGLKLVAKKNMPASFDPLKWTFHLNRLPQNAISELILIPILKAGRDHDLQSKRLFQLLQEKDLVLSKLFDRIGFLGIGLDMVFPGVSKKRIPREGSPMSHIGKAVKGAAPFNEEEWTKEFSKEHPQVRAGMDIVGELFDESSGNFTLSPAPDLWWTNLNHINKTSEARKNNPSKPRTQMDESADSEIDDDYFETRKLPPKDLRCPSLEMNRRPHTKTTQVEQRSLDSDADLTQSSEGSPPRQRGKSRVEAPRNIGSIGNPQKNRKLFESSTDSKSKKSSHSREINLPRKLGIIGKPNFKQNRPSTQPSKTLSADISETESYSGKNEANMPTASEDDTGDVSATMNSGQTMDETDREADDEPKLSQIPKLQSRRLGTVDGKNNKRQSSSSDFDSDRVVIDKTTRQNIFHTDKQQPRKLGPILRKPNLTEGARLLDPHLRPVSPKAAPQDVSTESDSDDLDRPARPRPTTRRASTDEQLPPRPPLPAKQPRKLGSIGSSRLGSVGRTRRLNPSTQPARQQPAHGDLSTDSESQSQSSLPVKQPRRLGSIGGGGGRGTKQRPHLPPQPPRPSNTQLPPPEGVETESDDDLERPAAPAGPARKEDRGCTKSRLMSPSRKTPETNVESVPTPPRPLKPASSDTDSEKELNAELTWEQKADIRQQKIEQSLATKPKAPTRKRRRY